MDAYRSKPPKRINNIKVVGIRDYFLRKEYDLIKNTEQQIMLPPSDVLQFFLKDGSKITVRPSGTEPKIKFYFGVKARLSDASGYDKAEADAASRLQGIIRDMDLK